MQEFAVAQQRNPYQSTRLLLDGQQRLTSLSAVIRGEPAARGNVLNLNMGQDQPKGIFEILSDFFFCFASSFSLSFRRGLGRGSIRAGDRFRLGVRPGRVGVV